MVDSLLMEVGYWWNGDLFKRTLVGGRPDY